MTVLIKPHIRFDSSVLDAIHQFVSDDSKIVKSRKGIIITFRLILL